MPTDTWTWREWREYVDQQITKVCEACGVDPATVPIGDIDVSSFDYPPAVYLTTYRDYRGQFMAIEIVGRQEK